MLRSGTTPETTAFRGDALQFHAGTASGLFDAVAASGYISRPFAADIT
jgi:hypothetical protein